MSFRLLLIISVKIGLTLLHNDMLTRQNELDLQQRNKIRVTLESKLSFQLVFLFGMMTITFQIFTLSKWQTNSSYWWDKVSFRTQKFDQPLKRSDRKSLQLFPVCYLCDWQDSNMLHLENLCMSCLLLVSAGHDFAFVFCQRHKEILVWKAWD